MKMKTDYITLKKEAPLECSKNIPRYSLVLGFYLGVLETVLNILSDNYDLAKSIFCQIITDYMPEHKGLLNKIDYTQLLSGEFADNLTYIHEAMLDLWMDIQEESLPHAEELDYKEVKNRLLDIRSALVELYQSAAS